MTSWNVGGVPSDRPVVTGEISVLPSSLVLPPFHPVDRRGRFGLLSHPGPERTLPPLYSITPSPLRGKFAGENIYPRKG